MPFGMKNPTSTFAKMMTEVFGTYMDKVLKNFVDDFSIHNLTWEEHLEHLCFILMKLKEANLKLNPKHYELPKLALAFWVILLIEKELSQNKRRLR
jgi:hypothetical protein